MKYILLVLIIVPSVLLSQSTMDRKKCIDANMKKGDKKLIRSFKKMECKEGGNYHILHIPSFSFTKKLSKQLLRTINFIDSMQINYQDAKIFHNNNVEFIGLIIDENANIVGRNNTNLIGSSKSTVFALCGFSREALLVEYFLVDLKYRQNVDYIFYSFNLLSYVYLKDGRWYLIKSELRDFEDKTSGFYTFSIPFEEYVDDNWERLKKIGIGKD